MHDQVHCLIGGTMCTVEFASAPEFFLHHGFIDKIWEDWQKEVCPTSMHSFGGFAKRCQVRDRGFYAGDFHPEQ